jgi:hypothetical protein
MSIPTSDLSWPFPIATNPCIAMIAKGRPENPLTRHINVRFFFVKDRVDAGELEIVYVPTEDLVADIMTKPLQGSRFRALRTKLMGMEC